MFNVPNNFKYLNFRYLCLFRASDFKTFFYHIGFTIYSRDPGNAVFP